MRFESEALTLTLRALQVVHPVFVFRWGFRGVNGLVGVGRSITRNTTSITTSCSL